MHSRSVGRAGTQVPEVDAGARCDVLVVAGVAEQSRCAVAELDGLKRMKDLTTERAGLETLHLRVRAPALYPTG